MGDVTLHFEPQLLWFQTPIVVARPCQCKLHQKALVTSVNLFQVLDRSQGQESRQAWGRNRYCETMLGRLLCPPRDAADILFS